MSRHVLRLLSLLMGLLLISACAAPAAPTAPTAAPAKPTDMAAAPTAAPVALPTAAPAQPTLKIVASTSWVGAFAKAAGATDITVIAPSNLQHPPDYDPKPSDLAAVSSADYVLLAGFEGFAARLQEAAGGDSKKVITVATENSPEAIRKEVTRLGELFGTSDQAAEYLKEFDTHYAHLAEMVKDALGGQQPVVVAQAFAVPWVMMAGLKPAGTYGPMPLTPNDLKALADAHPTVVFENAHMPGGQPIADATGATKIDLINFPGDDLDLMLVFHTNADRLVAALGTLPASTGAMTHDHAHTLSVDPFQISVAQYFMDSAGFHEMATVLAETKQIDAGYAATVKRVATLLAQTLWPDDVSAAGQAFGAQLHDFKTALEAGEVDKAIELSEAIHDAQHELSHSIDHALEHGEAATGEANAFDVAVAQYFMDSAGFHDMATALAETKQIEAAYLSTVTRVNKVLAHTTWPADLSAAAQAFSQSLTDFAAALEAGEVDKAIGVAETVHDAQHDLSHAIEHWLEDAPAAAAADKFDVAVAQAFLDTAGFHDMATALGKTRQIEAGYAGTVTRVNAVLSHTTWPADLNDAAQAFSASLGKFATALEAGNVNGAIGIAETVHDTQHELSHTIDQWLGAGSAHMH